MSQFDNNTFQKAGTIQVREGKKGLEFWAFNHERKRTICIGTLSGATYEKSAPVLNKPEASFCLPQSELAAIEQAGGQFIRFIGRGRPGTFAISVQEFKRYGEPYFNPWYGNQVRVSLTKFAYSPKVSKRNAQRDNPPIPREVDIVKEKQLTLLGWMK